MKYPEPQVTINGHHLTDGQAMALRVALDSFRATLIDDDALGEDEHGIAMTQQYRQRLVEISRMVHQTTTAAPAPDSR